MRRVLSVKLSRAGHAMRFLIEHIEGGWVSLMVAPSEIDQPMIIDSIRCLGKGMALPSAARPVIFGGKGHWWTLEALCLATPGPRWFETHVPEHTRRLIAARKRAVSLEVSEPWFNDEEN